MSMAQAQFKDGGGEDNAPDALSPTYVEDVEPDEYDQIIGNDIAMRAFLVKHYAASAYDIDGRVLCENLEHVFQWVKAGKVPAHSRSKMKVEK